MKLWKEITLGKQSHKKIHNISLSFHGLTDVGVGQGGIEGFLGERSSNGRKRSRDDEGDANGDEEAKFGFVCEKCKKRIRLSPTIVRSLSSEDDMGDVKEERNRLLENLRVEHADYHFARSLAHTVSDDDDSRESTPSVTKKKKKEGTGNGGKTNGSISNGQSTKGNATKASGIAKYFSAPSGSSSSLKRGKGK